MSGFKLIIKFGLGSGKHSSDVVSCLNGGKGPEAMLSARKRKEMAQNASTNTVDVSELATFVAFTAC